MDAEVGGTTLQREASFLGTCFDDGQGGFSSMALCVGCLAPCYLAKAQWDSL